MWDVYTWDGLVPSGSELSPAPMSYECPCEVIIPGWTITRLEEKGYSLWLLPRHRCRALALQVGFSSSPKIHSLALCSASEVILIHVGACPAFEPPPPRSSSRVSLLQGVHASSRRGGIGTPPEVYPALCVTVVFLPVPKVAIQQVHSEDDDPHLETCWMDHVDSWEGGAKTFKRGKTTVQIAFTSCPGAWTHQQQHTAARRVPGRPMYTMGVRVNPKTSKPGTTISITTRTSLQ